MRLADLLSGTDVDCPVDIREMEIKGIAFHSEEARNGDVFVRIKGSDENGKFYAMDAAFKGARVIVSDEDIDMKSVPVLRTENSKETLSILSHNLYKAKVPERDSGGGATTASNAEALHTKSIMNSEEEKALAKNFAVKSRGIEDIKIIGITGTNGKTTVSYLLKKIFEANNRTCGLIGTIEYSFGDTAYHAMNTTPEYVYLEKLLLEMGSKGVDRCVMEVSSQALELGRVDDISFDCGIFTNLSQDHLDFHKDMNSYFASKVKLFTMSKAANFINVDDEYGRELVDKLRVSRNAEILTYSVKDKGADYTCIAEEEKLDGTVISVSERGDLLGLLKIPYPGTYMISNTMAAIACARHYGMEFLSIKEGIENLGVIPGRFERVDNDQGKIIIIDYAHTPVALKNLLQTVNRFKKGKLCCVFGCGGDRDGDKRSQMGKVVGSYVDFAIITSDNPRSENQDQIAEKIEEGIYDTGCSYEVVSDRYEAIKKGISTCGRGDILVVAGKGHESSQTIGGEKKHFDDREAVAEILKGMD